MHVLTAFLALDACMQGLSPGTKYWYKVQSGTNESSIFHFVSMQAGQVKSYVQ